MEDTVESAIASELEGLQALYDADCVKWEKSQDDSHLGVLTVELCLNDEMDPVSFQFRVSRHISNNPPLAQVYVASKLNETLTGMLRDSIKEYFVPPFTFSFFHTLEHVREMWRRHQTHTELQQPSPLLLTKQDTVQTPSQTLTIPPSFTEFSRPIYSGEPLVDHKSVFQAHVASVYSTDEVRLFLSKLFNSSPKIQKATHNISAYRIKGSTTDVSTPGDEGKKRKGKTSRSTPHKTSPQTHFIQDHDSDGEKAAGGRLQHLLEILNVSNVGVVVSRWYGGIPLGPQRFRLINNCARQALIDGGFFNAG